ncbi:MAG: proline--tRNA ligase [Parcubacteria group bacterium CG2_30_36_18]|uniref:Proline--tRNA ligase n=4 Tax=Candidatus Nealsoniibacteriota TaxID=1817911 RepID=A0A2M8DLM8_9BACT|nr:MAG: proline--tRNA ligase [Parcubacteria group bacterium CG2_30_36_18]PIP24606.1 MAG: proline--tRNA ligase [Candidatus Nealsonbacteria bacterium CG23_combo_of_CG06-09_8_20_14_all_36_125]PIR72096.1 MAG: proline--tRNA ligase [Candidatus Nealsonbacteria bacterium CG10_big_fil_rev_8_21_14_0_10_36_228]PIX88361.1 MAG: proline--tRNA ligase [Candidatus Nealsonbacteria bacterium CG_4_10_14_3_um_filter_36_16]PJB98692.1 MAG: proline--tRNA ligase [Candidatus Nealsonbacteria bacterium CG_4_9_14_0_8_um_fi
MKKEFEKEKLLFKKSKDFSQWYTDVILKSGLADYAPVKGCMVIRPYGYAIWENIQKILDEQIKKAGVKNVYFPIFIPEKLLKKEKTHVKGFSPELAVVTIGGGKELKEKLVLRPTSETIIYEMFAKWIKSWRDLPILINQWCNVVRWEKRTYLFLRTTEFLWQEGHTIHETHEQAIGEATRALNNYVKLYRDFFAIDGIWGKKSESEKFPGAADTYAYEMLMPDGKALQGCTAHDLGQNFSKVFNIKFLGRDGKEKIPWQTSWGLSSRSIGALIMVHGDDNGLIIPPRLAPIQIIIIPIFQGKRIDKSLEKKSEELKKILKDFRIETDLRKEYSVGWKFNDWELKGVPLRIEIGPKEIKEKKITLVRRDTGERSLAPFSSLPSRVKKVLDLIQKNLFLKSRQYLKENTTEVFEYDHFKDIMKTKKGFLKAFWCENPKCEAKIKEETKTTNRSLPLDAPDYNPPATLPAKGRAPEEGKCIYCGKKARRRWIFAQAY